MKHFPLLVTALLALAPFAAPAQILVETIPERRARCVEWAKHLPAMEAQVRQFAAMEPQAVAAIEAHHARSGDVYEPLRNAGHLLLDAASPVADACAVAAPKTAARFQAVADTAYLVLDRLAEVNALNMRENAQAADAARAATVTP